MTPRKLVDWGIAISAVIAILAALVALFSDFFYYRRFPRIEALLGIESPGILPIVFVIVASMIATFVAFRFSSTQGMLEFKVLGVKVTGPSSPLLLWVVTFLAVSAVLLAFNAAFYKRHSQSSKSTEKTPIDTLAEAKQSPVEKYMSTRDAFETQVILDGDSTPEFRKTLSQSLTITIQHINNAANGELDLSQFNSHCSEFFTVDGANSLRRLIIRNKPIFKKQEIRLRLINRGPDSFEVRYVPIYLTKEDAKSDTSQSLIFKIERNGRVTDINFALSESESSFFKKVRSTSDTSYVLDFLERLKTAYNHKDISSIERVFSDKALIIVGFVLSGLKTQPNFIKDNSRISLDKINLIKLKKSEYISRLTYIFQRNPQIYVQFSSIEVTAMEKPKTFFVHLIQAWDSSRYFDKGHLFFLLDFRKPGGIIWVRAWFPLEEYLNPPLKPGEFDLSD